MYFGESVSKIDDKGRVTLPRRIRETMEVQGQAVWYMTRGFEHSLFLFPRDVWDKIRAQANRYSAMDAKVVDFRRLFFSSVAEVRPDNQGRIPVAPHLRDYARLSGEGREAVLIGVDDHLEVWNRDDWGSFVASKEAVYREMATSVFSGMEPGDNPSQEGAAQADARRP